MITRRTLLSCLLAVVALSGCRSSGEKPRVEPGSAAEEALGIWKIDIDRMLRLSGLEERLTEEQLVVAREEARQRMDTWVITITESVIQVPDPETGNPDKMTYTVTDTSEYNARLTVTAPDGESAPGSFQLDGDDRMTLTVGTELVLPLVR